MSKIRLTVSPEVREKLQRKQRSLDGDVTQLAFYAKSDFAAKIHKLAQTNKRSISSVLAELVEFAVQSLEDGDTELEPTPSNMHPLPRTSPLSYNDFAPGKDRNGKVLLRMTSAQPQVQEDPGAEALRRMGHEGIDTMSENAWQRESSAQNGYRWHELVDE